MTFKTDELLQTLQSQTEAILDKAIQSWQMINPARFAAQPQQGSWSAAQCLHHLNGYGDYYLPLLEKAILKAKASSDRKASFTPGWLGDYFTKLMLPEADGIAKKKMKAPKPNTPPSSVHSDQVLAQFIEQQERLLQLLESAKGLNLNHRNIPISIARFIRLKTGDSFRFLIAHNQRHVAQAERALKASQPSTKTTAALGI